MKSKNLLVWSFLGALAAGSFAKENAKEAAEKFKMIPAQELAQELKSNQKSLYIYDANNQETRSKYGIIPQAHLLVSSKDYDLKKELPADKTASLVFYCANQKCMASHQAANRAVKAGYTNVAVMPDGIMGWKEAGNPTQSAAN